MTVRGELAGHEADQPVTVVETLANVIAPSEDHVYLVPAVCELVGLGSLVKRIPVVELSRHERQAP